MMRMRLALRSATKRCTPAASTATPYGWSNCAAEPMPSTYPHAVPMAEPPPATMDTAKASGVVSMARMTWFAASAT